MISKAATRIALTALGALAVLAASSALGRSTGGGEQAQGTLTLRVVDDGGRAMAARARVGSWQATGPKDSAWGQQVVVREKGVSLKLTPGRYRVRVSRGIEYGITDLTVALASGGELSRTVTLAHQVQLPGWSGADLHVHTKHSGDALKHGGVTASDLSAEGVTLAAITDHNHVGDVLDGIDALAGAELTTWAPEVGHFNAFPLRELPSWRGTSPERLLAELAAQPDVFVQVNHPRLDDHIAYFELGEFDGERFGKEGFTLDMDGLEVWNGYDLRRPRHVKTLLGEWRHWVARGHRLTATGGSDSHGSPHHRPGYPRTYVRAASSTTMSTALKRGQAFVTNGPLLDLKVDGKTPGEHVRTAGRRHVVAELTVLAPDWLELERLEIWLGEKRVVNERIPRAVGGALRHRIRRSLELHGEKIVHAVVRGGRGLERLLEADVEPLAFTNAVYLDASRERRAP